MRVRVRFRYNSETGEVEQFVVEDIGAARSGVDHDAVHDAITADVARFLARNPVIDEVTQIPQPAASEVAPTAEPADMTPQPRVQLTDE